VGGYAGSLVTEWFRDRRHRANQREARAGEWAEKAEQRRRDFQRQTLLDLHNALFELVRTTHQLNLADKRAFRETGKWGQPVAPEELDEQDRLARAKFAILVVRVQDDQLRALLNIVRELTAHALLLAKSEQQAEAAMRDLGMAFESANAELGELLRALY